MKHILMRSRSLLGDYPYTVPGLGDKLHTIIIAHNYSIKHNQTVMLHMTEKQCYALIDKERKMRAWNEVIELLTRGAVIINCHRSAEPDTEDEWKTLVHNEGYPAEFYYYSDSMHMHPRDRVEPIDACDYLGFPEIPGIEQDVDLPEKFITTQWDSTDGGRRFSSEDISKILGPYIEQGYKVITVGGAAENPKFKQIKYCGYAMSKASYHVGVDSGFFHMAWCYLKPENIYLHVKKMNHHIARGEKMGVNVRRA
jgi:hypothetical protein